MALEIGNAFLTFKPYGENKSRVSWQGEVIGFEDDCVVAQLYEWIVGEPSNVVRIPVRDFDVPEIEGRYYIKVFPDYRARNEFYRAWTNANHSEI